MIPEPQMPVTPVVAEHDFGVGADIDQQCQLLGKVRALREDHAGGIRADVTGDTGEGVDPRARVQLQAELARVQAEGRVGRERKRCAAELGWIDAEQQVMHDGVANHRELENVGHLDLRFARDIGGEGVEGSAHRVGHLLRAAWVHHRVGHPAHEIFTEADLRIHRAA